MKSILLAALAVTAVACALLVPALRADEDDNKGGPPEYVEKNWDKLVAVAQSIQDLAVEQAAAAKK